LRLGTHINRALYSSGANNRQGNSRSVHC